MATNQPISMSIFLFLRRAAIVLAIISLAASGAQAQSRGSGTIPGSGTIKVVHARILWTNHHAIGAKWRVIRILCAPA